MWVPYESKKLPVDQSARLHCARGIVSEPTHANKQTNKQTYERTYVGKRSRRCTRGNLRRGPRTCGNGRSLSPRPRIRNRITASCHSIVPPLRQRVFVDRTRTSAKFRIAQKLDNTGVIAILNALFIPDRGGASHPPYKVANAGRRASRMRSSGTYLSCSETRSSSIASLLLPRSFVARYSPRDKITR